MKQSEHVPARSAGILSGLAILAVFLALVLGTMFVRGFLPGHTIFSNDGPLGALSAKSADLPSGFFGYWQDLNSLGVAGPSASPDISQIFTTLSGKLWFSKLFPPFCLFFLGLSAFFCFRQWRFTPTASVLGGLAAALNGDFFSTACWGVVSQPIGFGVSFIAIGLLADDESPRRWLKAVLAGFAVGMGVMEAFDIGAIFSLFVAAFVLFQAITKSGTPARKFGLGVGRIAVVAAFAAFISFATVITLVGTQIKGISGIDAGQETREQRWDWATQWSLPKREILDVVLPGIYGFRMDTPNGGQYWGAGGRDPSWDKYFESGKQGPPPQGGLRFSGGGHYAGSLVLLAAIWAVAQSFRKANSLYTPRQKQFVWFWLGVVVVSMLLAFGRFAPFYQFFFMIPYASTIRNPAKFIHVLEWALVILAAYGLDGITRAGLQNATGKLADMPSHFRNWWAKAAAFDRKWVRGCAIGLGVLLLGWAAYASAHDKLVAYLHEVGFEGPEADAIASFSIRQPGWPVLFLGLSSATFALLLSGYFAGKRARTACIILGVILVADLARANVPWVVTYDYKSRYATNPVIDFLRENAHEQRVCLLPLERLIRFEALPPEARSLASSYLQLRNLYHVEWMQHHFQYYNIPALEVVQMSRVPADLEAFQMALAPNPVRYWELTSTRYLLAPAVVLDYVNQQLDPVRKRFHMALRFDITLKPGVSELHAYEDLTAVASTNGQYAVFEFSGALPRANLCQRFEVNTNDQQTLKVIAAPQFDPARVIILAENPPRPSQLAGSTNEPQGTVEFVSYAPKDILLKSRSTESSVLMMTDKFDPNWKATIDGQPAPVLRCDFIMRGVQVPAGDHNVEFRFAPSVTALYISLVAVAMALLLCAYLVVSALRRKEPVNS